MWFESIKCIIGDYVMPSLVDWMRVGDHDEWIKFRFVIHKLMSQMFLKSGNRKNYCCKELSDFFIPKIKVANIDIPLFNLFILNLFMWEKRTKLPNYYVKRGKFTRKRVILFWVILTLNQVFIEMMVPN